MPLHTVRQVAELGREDYSDRVERHILEAVLRRNRTVLPPWVMEHYDPHTWPTLTSVAPLRQLNPTRITQALNQSVNHRSPEVNPHQGLRPNTATRWHHRRAQIADILIDMYVKVVKESFEYIYGGLPSTGVFTSEVFRSDGSAHTPYYGNCQQLAKNFLLLLTYFGFPANRLRYEAAPSPNGLDKPDIRLLGKSKDEVSTQDVCGSGRGASGFHEHHDDKSRGFRLVKKGVFRSYYDVKQHYRDPFTTHWAIDVSAFGLPFRTYDPLCGLKYRNGMSDRFHEYRIMGSFQTAKIGKFTVFWRLDDPRYRLYEIPDRLTFPNATFRAIRTEFSHLGSLWMVVEPDDWGSRTERPGARDRTISWSHPKSIAEVYGLN